MGHFKGLVLKVMIVDYDSMHLEVLNRMPVNMLAITAKRSGIEYEINDGKIVAEITNVK